MSWKFRTVVKLHLHTLSGSSSSIVSTPNFLACFRFSLTCVCVCVYACVRVCVCVCVCVCVWIGRVEELNQQPMGSVNLVSSPDARSFPRAGERLVFWFKFLGTGSQFKLHSTG